MGKMSFLGQNISCRRRTLISSLIPCCFFVIPDGIVPRLTFINAPVKTSGSPIFSWRSTEQATFKCSLDNGIFEDCGSGTSGTWKKEGLGDGRHALRVKAIDSVGNEGPSVTHIWTVGKRFYCLFFDC